jgi:hypothetical protein
MQYLKRFRQEERKAIDGHRDKCAAAAERAVKRENAARNWAAF